MSAGALIAVLAAGVACNGGGASPGGGGGHGGGGAAGGHTNPLGQALIDELVTGHNQARGGPLVPPPSPPLPPVAWDATLADVAYDYASRCPGSGGLLAHNANRTSDYAALGGGDYVGENIYGTSADSVRPADALTLWMSEAPIYDYDANNIGDAGHYTQIVWRASVRIGCAIVDCPTLTYRGTIVCDYAPGGNITNQKPY